VDSAGDGVGVAAPWADDDARGAAGGALQVVQMSTSITSDAIREITNPS
jgi:hypothetical protein